MAYKLCAYISNNQIIGIEKTKWKENDLNGNLPFILSETVPEGYSDISSIENWYKFGLNIFDDYQCYHRAIKLEFYKKGWDNCTDTEKEIVINMYCNPDLGNNIQNTQNITYLITKKGMTLEQAENYLIEKWSEHYDKFILSCQQRLLKAIKIAVKYLGFQQAADLGLKTEIYQNRYLNKGILGIGYGDPIPGIMNFIHSNAGITNGLTEQNYTLRIGDLNSFKQELEYTFLDDKFWPEIKNYL